MSTTHPPTSFRLPPELLSVLEEAARAKLRSRSKQLEQYIRDGLQRDGLLPPVDATT